MSTGVLRCRVAGGHVRAALAATLGQVPLVVLSAAAVGQLEAECGSAANAARWLLRLATRRQRPIGLHSEGQTVFISPQGWSTERLLGYVAA
jgi:hypothetical protein